VNRESGIFCIRWVSFDWWVFHFENRVYEITLNRDLQF